MSDFEKLRSLYFNLLDLIKLQSIVHNGLDSLKINNQFMEIVKEIEKHKDIDLDNGQKAELETIIRVVQLYRQFKTAPNGLVKLKLNQEIFDLLGMF